MDTYKVTKYRNLEEAARDVRESMERVWKEARALGLNHPFESFKARDERQAAAVEDGVWSAPISGNVEELCSKAARLGRVIAFNYNGERRIGLAVALKYCKNGTTQLVMEDEDRDGAVRSFNVRQMACVDVYAGAARGADETLGDQLFGDDDETEGLSERLVDAVSKALGVDVMLGSVAVSAGAYDRAVAAVDTLLIPALKAVLKEKGDA